MCTQNSCSLASCMGESRAAKSESHPLAKQTIESGRSFAPLRRIRSRPARYISAVAKSGALTSRDHPHPQERVALSALFANACAPAITSATPAANWKVLLISLTRIQNPSRNRLGDDDHGKREAENNSEKDLEVC